MRQAGHVAHMTYEQNAYRFLVEKINGKRPLKRPICVWGHNIKVDLWAIGWDGMDRIIWLRVGHDNEPSRPIKC
jgi:hypothetical protein